MFISIETKLRFNTPQDKKTVINAMRQYTAMIRYGIKCLTPNFDAQKEVYYTLTEKFSSIPSRVVTLGVQSDIKAIINSYTGLTAKNYPLTIRFDRGCATFFVEENKVKVEMAIHRVEKGKIDKITAFLTEKKNLKYKYYKLLFATKKGYKLPFKLVMRNGQIYAKISVEKEKMIAQNVKPHLNIGIDLNAYWVGKGRGNPLGVSFLNDDGTFARQPLLIKEWAAIPCIIREKQREGRAKVKKAVKNQMGLIIKKILALTKDYDVTFKVEDLKGLNKVKGPYSKFFYREFTQMLENKSLQIMYVDPRYTSKICSKCGDFGVTDENRMFFCEKCYTKGINRDINAAVNIAKKQPVESFLLAK